MRTANRQILFTLILLCLGTAVLQAQQGRQMPPRQQVDPYTLAVQYGKKTLAPDRLSAGQQRHLKWQMAINQAIAQGDYNKEKVFEAAYSPVAEWMQMALPEFQKFEEAWHQQCEEALSNDDQKTAALADYQAKLFAELVRISGEMLEAYRKKQSSKLNTLIKDYQTCEGYFLMKNIKPPKRDWLTAQEANYLSSLLSRKRGK